MQYIVKYDNVVMDIDGKATNLRTVAVDVLADLVAGLSVLIPNGIQVIVISEDGKVVTDTNTEFPLAN